VIDLARLNRIHLERRPLGQKIVANLFLGLNYNWPGKRTGIRLEGTEHLPPNGGAIFVMNHTDRYNYWPFQYKLYREGFGFTATWVKGKYYESDALGWFMDKTNNIPLPSKGYVFARDFKDALRRVPSDAEYAALKSYLDGKTTRDEAIRAGGDGVAAFLARPWPDGGGDYARSLEARFRAMMERVVAINQQALKTGLNLLIFPQGTRSKRLTKGLTGAAQMILYTQAPVIPVGCNGSDEAYPRNSPWSQGGNLVYRIGKPLTAGRELAPWRIDEPFVPFTQGAEKFQPKFRGVTDYLMDRINELLDPEYQYGAGDNDEKGAKRFL
jgi:1-acyl-sn-glycerol-3-phosphate acyltransferase